MKCPIDGTQLVMTDRSGVEIDYCPQCRGVWLDRGELDKIIERSATEAAPSHAYGDPRRHDGRDSRDDRRDHDDRRYEAPRRYDDDYRYKYKGKRKKRGVSDFLDDIFDF
ncbi:TFIIB-type zinc ribbon-containing protein [Marinibacterium profundimaris]|uniref:Transcription factor zinc-finger domain-containing protein n=1 Tax=Marinibacterium profundimaris TaxID=1679460 RepID=A0A225NJ47_9RHOB|nr:zf-TFIIB domain-containing protein [Marinibacterium profundimaris]OWU73251.1 hypothetical protein ATO3_11135 [Marinibacterium profundimaris]